jgi:hypothetical protein
MKTVPESVEGEFSRRNLLSGIHKGLGTSWWLKKGQQFLVNAHENQNNPRTHLYEVVVEFFKVLAEYLFFKPDDPLFLFC